MYDFPEIVYSVFPSNWIRMQHRLMSEGRAIAMGSHPRRVYKERNGNIFTFIDCKVRRAIEDMEFKDYRVDWDGIGDPLVVMGVEEGSANPGGTVTTAATRLSIDSTFGIYAPDSFVWAVWFLVNENLNPPVWPPYSNLTGYSPLWADVGVGPPFP